MMFWSNSSSSTYRTFAQIWAFDLSARSLTFSVCTRFIKILRSTSLWKFRQRQGQCGPMWQIRPSWGTAYVMNIWGGCGNRMQYEMQIVADSCFALAREEGKLLYTSVILCHAVCFLFDRHHMDRTATDGMHRSWPMTSSTRNFVLRRASWSHAGRCHISSYQSFWSVWLLGWSWLQISAQDEWKNVAYQWYHIISPHILSPASPHPSFAQVGHDLFVLLRHKMSVALGSFQDFCVFSTLFSLHPKLAIQQSQQLDTWGELNQWPGLTNLELVSITCKVGKPEHDLLTFTNQ